MSAAKLPGTVAIGWYGGPTPCKRLTPASVVRLAGAAALGAVVCGSLWIAALAADSPSLLELPTRAGPSWIEGPLHGIGALLGPLGTPALSAALIALMTAYVLALACARSIPLRLALASVVTANLAFMLGPTIVSTDVFGYTAYAREAAHGLNPYVLAPTSIAPDGILQFVYWKHQPSPYGPLFTALSTPLGLVPAAVAMWSYKAVAGAAGVLTTFLVADLARRRGLNPARAAILVGLNPVLLLYAVSGAHNDLSASLLVVCALALALRGRESAATGVAVAAAAIKLTLGLALPFIWLGSRHRVVALRGATVAVMAIGVPTLLLFGTHVADQLHRIVSGPSFDIAFSGPDRLATALGQSIDGPLRALCTALAAGVAVLMLLTVWRGADTITAAGWAFLALIASIASLAPWYLVWLLPLAALGRSRGLRVAAIMATFYLIAVHTPALGGHLWLSGPAGGQVGARVTP